MAADFFEKLFSVACLFSFDAQKIRRGILISYQATAIARQACAWGDKTQRIAFQSASSTVKRCEYTLHKREI
jgi:hypothetical protein